MRSESSRIGRLIIFAFTAEIMHLGFAIRLENIVTLALTGTIPVVANKNLSPIGDIVSVTSGGVRRIGGLNLVLVFGVVNYTGHDFQFTLWQIKTFP